MAWTFQLITVATVVVLVAIFVEVMYRAGEFKSLVTAGIEGCVIIGQNRIVGPEDLHTTPDGLAFISSDDRHYWHTPIFWNVSERIPGAQKSGGVYLYNHKDGSIREMPLSSFFSKGHVDFHPHGISLLPRLRLEYTPPDDSTLLYVVNHRRDGEIVEVFRVQGKNAVHLKSIKSEKWKYINDVAAVADGFYVSNWMTYAMIEHPLAIPEIAGFGPELGIGGYLIFCSLSVEKLEQDVEPDCHVVAENLYMPNGVEVSADGKQVFVIESLKKRLRVFDVAEGGHGKPLIRKKVIGTANSACDNIALTAEGKLMTGCHPKVLSFQRHFRDPNSYKSPSLVLHIDPQSDEVKEVLLVADGNPISASTCANPFGSYLLVGSVTENGLMRCPFTVSKYV